MQRALRPLHAAIGIITAASAAVVGQSAAAWPDARTLPGTDNVKAFIASQIQRNWTPPKTPWGDPDIQGVFTTKDEANTPFERPDEWAGKRMADITPKEFAEAIAKRQQEAVERAPFLGGGDELIEAGVAIGIPIHFLDNLTAKNSRPWFIIDPAEGKIPALAPGAAAYTSNNPGFFAPERDSYTQRSLTDRCVGGSVWSTPGIYGNSYEIVQTPNHVVFRYEGMRASRMIRLNAPHRTANVREHYGDSIGWFDGTTLVVETINFPERVAYRGYKAHNVRLIERLTRTAPNKVEWTATIDAPTIWSRPWTYSYPMTEDNTQPIFEYACHEGNYALANILSAGRADGKKKADAENRIQEQKQRQGGR